MARGPSIESPSTQFHVFQQAEGLYQLEQPNNWNAYVWWYLQRYYSFIGDGEEGTTNGMVLKRGYAFANFSKFVRPNFVRIGTETVATNYLKISAYKKDNQTVVVILNPEGFTVRNVQINGLTPSSATAYTTSETANLTKKVLTVADKVIEMDIPPSSVTTIVINN